MSKTEHESSYPYIGEHTNLADNVRYFNAGMIKREAFAMAAMQGILSSRELQLCLIADQKHDGTTSDNYIAVYAVKQADT